MMGLGMKRREFITGLRGPRAGRRGIRAVGSPYWRAPAPKPRSGSRAAVHARTGFDHVAEIGCLGSYPDTCV